MKGIVTATYESKLANIANSMLSGLTIQTFQFLPADSERQLSRYPLGWDWSVLYQKTIVLEYLGFILEEYGILAQESLESINDLIPLRPLVNCGLTPFNIPSFPFPLSSFAFPLNG